MTGPRRPSDIVQPVRPRPEAAPPPEPPAQGQPSAEQMGQLMMLLMMLMQAGQGGMSHQVTPLPGEVAPPTAQMPPPLPLGGPNVG